jgi:hypothetical protein
MLFALLVFDNPTIISQLIRLLRPSFFYSINRYSLLSTTCSLDFMDKNKDKLEKPKGSGGSHSGYQSMY